MANITTLSDTNTYEDKMNKINEVIAVVNAEIVDVQVATLETVNKNSLVEAINEVNSKPNFLTFYMADGSQSNITLGAS